MEFLVRNEFLVIVSVCVVLEQLLFTNALPIPEVHVDGYQEMEEPIYPFQQYIQVRKSFSVEHVPAYDETESSPSNLQALASNTNGDKDHFQTSSSDHSSHEDDYIVPRLRKEVTDWKKQEVYEEKGYGDSAFDHDTYKLPSHEENHYEQSPQSDSNSNSADEYQPEASSYVSRPSSDRPRRPNYRKRYYPSSLHSPDGSSTRLLEYVAALHDRETEAKGPYASRDHIHCPEMIDFDLSSKDMRMGEGYRGAQPRLRGLGSKINCMKNKYFGNEPLSSEIFHSPSEDSGFAIDNPSFDKFFDMVRGNVEHSSSYQNSNMPQFK